MKLKTICSAVLLLIFVAVSNLNAQRSGQAYIPGTLIIQFEDENTLQLVKSKRKSVQSDAFSTFGIDLSESVWRPEFDRASRLIRAKRKPENLDLNKISTLENKFRLTYNAHVVDQPNLEMIARKISQLPGVAWAEPRYLYETTALPNDPLSGTGLSSPYVYQRFDEAWAVTQGSPDVLIAIVDSGVDYEHPDLDDHLAINENEVPDNGVDDDENGYVDDVLGWDFWEAGYTFGTLEQDNDPMGTGSDHGTHVAGIAAAETNNGEGIPGAGYNCRYIAVKAGGVRDNPDTPDVNESRSVGFGYEGIVYSVLRGAHVINNSWSGPTPSSFGREIIEYAVANDVVVVSSAGNHGDTTPHYPASYEGSMSIGNIVGDERMASSSAYGYKLDVSATGSSITSTVFNDNYGAKTGTSMSGPMVAGLAGLVRAQYPDWTADRVRLQIRSSAVNIDEFNLGKEDELGTGRIDAFKAVSTPLPAIRVNQASLLNDADRKIALGETGKVRLSITNVGAATQSLTVTAESFVNGLTVDETPVNAGVLDEGETLEVDIPIEISANFNTIAFPTLKLSFDDTGTEFADFRVVELQDFAYEALDVNNVYTSLAADGTMGYFAPGESTTGVGFSVNTGTYEAPDFSDNLLYTSNLVVAFNGKYNGNIYDANGTQLRHFRTRSMFRQIMDEEGNLEGTGSFDNAFNLGAPRFMIDMESFASSEPNLRNAVFVKYTITNTTNDTVENVYAGVYNDWDMGDYTLNRIGYSFADSIMYVYENGNNQTPYVATASMRGLPVSSLFAIDNAASGAGSTNWGIYDGLTDQEKEWMLTNGLAKTTITGDTDVSAATAYGPFTLEPDESVSVGFIHAYGMSIEELRSVVFTARRNVPFEELFVSNEQEDLIPLRTELKDNYPNPFNPSTSIRYNLAQAGQIKLEVYSILGQKVATLVDETMAAGSYQVNFDASGLASGVYITRLTAGNQVLSKKMTLIK